MSFMDYTITLTEPWQILAFALLYATGLVLVIYSAKKAADKSMEPYREAVKDLEQALWQLEENRLKLKESLEGKR